MVCESGKSPSESKVPSSSKYGLSLHTNGHYLFPNTRGSFVQRCLADKEKGRHFPNLRTDIASHHFAEKISGKISFERCLLDYPSYFEK